MLLQNEPCSLHFACCYPAAVSLPYPPFPPFPIQATRPPPGAFHTLHAMRAAALAPHVAAEAHRELAPGVRPADIAAANRNARRVLPIRKRDGRTEAEIAAAVTAGAQHSSAVIERDRDRWGFPCALERAHGAPTLLPPNPFAAEDPWRYMPLQAPECVDTLMQHVAATRGAEAAAALDRKKAFLQHCYEQRPACPALQRAAARQRAVQAALEKTG